MKFLSTLSLAWYSKPWILVGCYIPLRFFYFTRTHLNIGLHVEVRLEGECKVTKRGCIRPRLPPYSGIFEQQILGEALGHARGIERVIRVGVSSFLQ